MNENAKSIICLEEQQCSFLVCEYVREISTWPHTIWLKKKTVKSHLSTWCIMARCNKTEVVTSGIWILILNTLIGLLQSSKVVIRVLVLYQEQQSSTFYTLWASAGQHEQKRPIWNWSSPRKPAKCHTFANIFKRTTNNCCTVLFYDQTFKINKRSSPQISSQNILKQTARQNVMINVYRLQKSDFCLQLFRLDSTRFWRAHFVQVYIFVTI